VNAYPSISQISCLHKSCQHIKAKLQASKSLFIDGTPGGVFKLELKEQGDLGWKKEIVLNGGAQIINLDLPALGCVYFFI
jgi:hypothetical protein